MYLTREYTLYIPPSVHVVTNWGTAKPFDLSTCSRALCVADVLPWCLCVEHTTHPHCTTETIFGESFSARQGCAIFPLDQVVLLWMVNS